MRHFVACRPQVRVRILVVQSLVDQFLGMLHAQPHGERFRLHGHLLLPQHLKGIPGTVADGQNADLGLNLLPIGQSQAPQDAALLPESYHLRLKLKGAAHRLNLPAKRLHNGDQHIRPQVWLLIKENFPGSSRLHKPQQHFSIPPGGIFHQSIQLSVRERSRAPLAKLYIGVGVQRAALPEGLH